MKLRAPSSLLGMAVLLCLIMTSRAEPIVYTMDASTAQFSTTLGDGGTVTVDYVLTSGTPIASLGTSFAVTYTFSDLIQTAPGIPSEANYQWYGPATDLPANNIGVSLDYYSILGSSTDSTGGNHLPPNNTGASYPIAGWGDSGTSLDEWYRTQIANDTLSQLGTFTVSAEAISAPSGYSIVSDEVIWGGRIHASYGGDDNSILISLWSAPDGSAPASTFSSYTGTTITTHGISQTFNYTGNRIPGWADLPLPHNARGFWTATGSITFEEDEFMPIPEPSSGALLLGSAVALIWIHRRRSVQQRSGTCY